MRSFSRIFGSHAGQWGMLTFVLGLLGGGVLIALGFSLHLAWFWVTGQDYRTPEERAWEATERRAAPGQTLARTTSDLS